MKYGASICRFAILSVLFALAGCSFIKREPPLEETPATQGNTPKGQYDPLALAQDTIVITEPEQRKSAPGVADSKPDDATSPSGEPSRISGVELGGAGSSSSQVFRVQLLTLNAYGEGRRALAVAQEMFDQSATLDYEVPYFKLRVGQFAVREAAERYLQRARTAGYANALVVKATVGVHEASALYESSAAKANRAIAQPSDSGSAAH
jgi:hypothetical protein